MTHKDHVIYGVAVASMAVSPRLYGSTEVGAPGMLESGTWGEVEDMEGRESIRRGLQREVTPEFHLEEETGLMEGRWGKGREEWGFGPSKGVDRSCGWRGREAKLCSIEEFSCPSVMENGTWRMGFKQSDISEFCFRKITGAEMWKVYLRHLGVHWGDQLGGLLHLSRKRGCMKVWTEGEQLVLVCLGLS